MSIWNYTRKDWMYIGAFLLFLVAAKVGYAAITYGDWTCAFADCVKVK